MTTTIAPETTPEPGPPPRPSPRHGFGDDFRALRGTLVTVGAVILAVVVAMLVGMIWFKPTKPLPVKETDYRIAMSTRLRAGSHKISLVNAGAQPHELLVFRTALAASKLPVGSDGDVEEESPLMHNVLDSGSGLQAGKTQHLAVKLQPGHYVAVCNLPQHYRLGMRVDLDVTK